MEVQMANKQTEGNKRLMANRKQTGTMRLLDTKEILNQNQKAVFPKDSTHIKTQQKTKGRRGVYR